jgi:hypothetical protein
MLSKPSGRLKLFERGKANVVGSVANWPKLRPQNTKVAPYKSQRPEETVAEFFADFSKIGRKVAKLFCCVYFTNTGNSLDYLKK